MATNGTISNGEQPFSIPVIDFSAFLHPRTTADATACAQAVVDAFKTAGFVYLSNHDLPASSIEKALGQSRKFFTESSMEDKEALAWDNPASNRGYMRPGREKVTTLTVTESVDSLRAAIPDLKETIDFGREGEEGRPNQWPRDPRFKEDVYAFWEECKALHVEIMRAIALGLGYERAWFDENTDGGDNTLRLLHYPAVSKKVFKENQEQVRAGAHCDYGSITLLFQDTIGGLEVQTPTGTFIPATPIPGTVIVNAGDLLARWSNGLIKSTMHRVVQPTGGVDSTDEEGEYPERYSIAYFCNPNFDKMISALPGTWSDGNPKRWEPILSGDYLYQRLAVTVQPY